MPTRDQIEKLLALEPDDAFLLYAMGQDLANNDEHEEALVYFDRTLASDPGYCYAYYFKARSLVALGRTDEATAVLEEGLETAKRVGDAKAASELTQLRAMYA
jgi:predicted Zn-dependent protease